MNCPYCHKEYYEKDQKICEFCGSDLINEAQEIPKQITTQKYNFDSLLDDLGLKDLRNKIKKKIRELKS